MNHIGGSSSRLRKRKATTVTYFPRSTLKGGAHLTFVKMVGQLLPPLPRLHAHPLGPTPTPKRAIPPAEDAFILPGHERAVELLVHCIGWRGSFSAGSKGV